MQTRSKLTLLTTAAAVFALAMPALADTIVVRPGDSVQDAFDAATSGDTVLIKGRHVESATLAGKTDVTVRGLGRKASITSPFRGVPALSLDACTDVTVERLELVAAQTGAVTVTRSQELLLTKCTLRGPSILAPAVEVTDSEAITISRNRFKGAMTLGVMLGTEESPTRMSVVARNRFQRISGAAIEVHGSQNVVLRNTIKKGGSGIVVHGDDAVETNVIRRNKVVGPRGHAVRIAAGAAVVDENAARVAVLDTIRIESQGAIVSANKVKAACRHGIAVKSSNAAIVGNRVVRSTDDAIHVDGDENLIRNNVLKGSGESGIDLDGDANLVNGNTFGGNDVAVDDSGDDNLGSDVE